jgi:C-terminal processing protease CtpA/Prc
VRTTFRRGAGVREEDVLVAIDGRPAAALTLEEVRAQLRREGEERVLTIKRGDERRRDAELPRQAPRAAMNQGSL